MITFQEAQTIVKQQARSFGQERVPLEQAYGRILAETVTADRDYPPFNRSSMDGFALRIADLEAGLRHFTIVETIFAGMNATRHIGSGQCYKIMTGAPVPSDADIVIRREDTREGEGIVELALPAAGKSSFRPFQNIARQGEDLRSGDLVIDRPQLCQPALMGLLASLGRKELLVQRLPRVALLTTGNEVVDVGQPVSSAQIRNSNRWLLQSFLHKNGITPSLYEHLPDQKSELHRALTAALDNDIVILSGGVSAGDADYVPAVLEELGVKKLFHKLAIKPGKPAWCGLTTHRGMVFALPGNPFSCLVGFTLLIQPFLDACWGVSSPAPLGLPLQTARRQHSVLDEFFPVLIEGDPAQVKPMPLNGSGDIRMGLGAQALALHPAAAGDLPEGSLVACYSLV